MNNGEELKQAFFEYANNDIEGAMSLIMGLFIGLNEAYIELRGEDGTKEIRLETLNQRNVTIHKRGEASGTAK